MSESNAVQPADLPEAGENAPSGAAKAALAEEALLNAAVAFAGHVATAAQQGAAQSAEQASAAVREAVLRQYLLETATLCLRRLGESYEAAAGDPALAGVIELLNEGAKQARDATVGVEALGDLSLDLLDQLLGE